MHEFIAVVAPANSNFSETQNVLCGTCGHSKVPVVNRVHKQGLQHHAVSHITIHPYIIGIAASLTCGDIYCSYLCKDA